MTVMNSGIYRIELGNGHFYIGSAVNLRQREHQHRRALKRGDHTNIKVQNCWNKYGVFVFTVLEVCSKAGLIVREDTYLKTFFSNPKNANIAPNAGSPLGVVHSDEARANMSAAKKGKTFSAEQRANMSAAQKGRTISAEHRANISAALKGRTCSAETRAILSAALKGKTLSAEHCANMSTALKGKTRSDEVRANMSAALKGIPKSAETRANMVAAQRLRRAKAAQTVTLVA